MNEDRQKYAKKRDFSHTVSEPASAAAILKENRKRILETWEERTRASTPAARALDSQALIDSLPIFLAELIEQLEHAEREQEVKAREHQTAREHGDQRSQIREYTIAQVIHEYRIFRDVLFEVIEEHGILEPVAREIILHAVDLGIGNAAASFAAMQLKIETEQKSESREREAIINTLFDASPVGLALLDNSLRYLRINPVLAEMNGVPLESHIGRAVSEVLPELSKAISPLLKKIIETGEPLLNFEGTNLSLSEPKQIQHFLANYYPVRTPDGSIIGIGAAVTDITERKQIERRIRESEARLVFIADSISTLLAQVDQQERYLFVNEAYAKLLGKTPNDIVGKTVREVLGHERYESIKDQIRDALAGKAFTYETSLPFQNGKKHVLATYVPSLNAEGKTSGFIANITDIDRLKEFEERQAQSLITSKADIETLKREREIREEFVATLSHDLRNPLSAAKMRTQILLRLENDQEKMEKLLGIVGDIDRTDRMIQDLLDANRIRAGQAVPLRIESCHLKTIVTNAIAGLSLTNQNRFDVRSDEEVVGFWDKDGLQRVIENLAGNAVKYGAANTPVKITLTKAGDKVRAAIFNEGQGLTVHEQQNIFDPFHRTKSAEHSEKQGWGLGLTLVRGISEAHGGRVWVESELGVGVTFTVELPLDSRPFQDTPSNIT